MRRLRRLVIAAVGALLAVVTLGWGLACRELDRQTRQFLQAAGWELATGATQWRGWPLAASVVWPEVRLRSGPAVAPPLLWTAGSLRLRVSPLHPSALVATAGGGQSLGDGSAPPVRYTARDLHAAIDLSGAAPLRLLAEGLDALVPNGHLGIGQATLSLPPGSLEASVSGIAIPALDGHEITPKIDGLQVLATIEPGLPPMRSPRESASVWREGGGTVQLRRAWLRWGALEATGHATLRLDGALQPVVMGEVTAAGLHAVLDALAENGAITRANATAAQAMLLILAAPAGGGPVTLPITIESGVLTIARFPLLRLPKLAWE